MKSTWIVAVLTLLLASSAIAQPTISGPQSGTLGPGEYVVTGHISIVDGSTLTIEPGTTFLFDGWYRFTIGSNRTLIAQGTETDSIRFMPNVDNGVTQWANLQFDWTDSDDVMGYCLITGGASGAIYCNGSSPTFSNCTIRDNSNFGEGGGIYCNGSSPTLTSCVIIGNSSFRGGGFYCNASSPTISNCTISGNSADDYGDGISCSGDSNPAIVNSTVTNNDGHGVYVLSPASPDINYCNVSDNSGGDYAGSGIDPSLGVITGTNYNGDPCDMYSNISLDPLFVDPSSGDYHLQEGSPCIDAGDPYYPRDPDNSYPDIGAFYYHQEGVIPSISGSLSGTLIPGDYIVTGDLSIVDGETLTIPPGTTFLFDGDFSFIIESNRTLIAQGTETDSIKFTPNTDNGVTQWGHLEFNGSANDDILEFCLVTGGHAASPGGGIYCDLTHLTINHCTISDNYTTNSGGGVFCEDSNVTISYCTITGNYADLDGGGIYLESLNPTVTHCTISNNSNNWGYGAGIMVGNDTANITHCVISENNGGPGGGIYFHFADGTVADCTINDNTSSTGGGIMIEDSEVAISSCTIIGNQADNGGGGIAAELCEATITDCVIAFNSAEAGGGIFIDIMDQTLDYVSVSRSTISHNSAMAIGGGICQDQYGANLVNTAITCNTGEGFYQAVPDGTIDAQHCNLFGNSGGAFVGTDPSYGLIVGENPNGEPWDVHCNIFEEPMYVDGANGNFELIRVSACVDAGVGVDPDGTPADIGKHYFDHDDPDLPPFEVYLVADDPLIVPAGSDFTYRIAIFYDMAQMQFVDIWTEAVLPNSNTYGPIWQINNFPMVDGTVIDVQPVGQTVPGSAPEGIYSFVLNVGNYPNLVAASDEFEFEVVAGATMTAGVSAWTGYGFLEAFEQVRLAAQTEPDPARPAEFAVSQAYPNPFNPTTTLTVSLSSAAQLDIAVFNVMGQQVAEIANGGYNAGTHTLVFDSNGLASGVYFIHTQAPGHLNQVQKVMLVR